eukprot:gene3142-5458_t
MSKVLKVLFIGLDGTGKTSYTEHLKNKTIQKDVSPTIGAMFSSVNRKVHGNLRIQIWDTAGNKKYHSLLSMYFRNSEALFLFFDLTRMETLQTLTTLMKKLKPTCKCILIGTKYDLTTSINEYVIQNFIDDHPKIVKYFSVSCKTGFSVDWSFDTGIYYILGNFDNYIFPIYQKRKLFDLNFHFES